MLNCTLCNGSDLKSVESDFEKNFFECLDCGLLFIDPEFQLKPNIELERYKLHQNDHLDPNYRQFLSKATTPLLPYVNSNMIGLDYGSGPGPTVCKIFADLGIKVENYDPYFAPREFKHSDKFDFITCTETMEHFYNPYKEFTQISKLLKPGGYLSVMTEVFEGTIPFRSWWYAKDPTHVSLYQPKTLEWIANKFDWHMEKPHKNVRIYRNYRNY